MTNAPEPPVIIAGGGAVGATLALMLARHGVSSVVVEQTTAPRWLPRAHAVNPRSIENLAEIGITAEHLSAVAAPKALTADVRFVSTLTGHCFGVLPYERQDDEVLSVTPAAIVNIPQPALEALLFERVEANPLIDFRRGHEWLSGTQSDGYVSSTVRRQSGTYEIQSRYLIGADGAGSAVRTWLDVETEGIDDIASAISITFSADLSEFLRTRPGILHWVFRPELRGSFIAYAPERLWSFVTMLPAGRVDLAQYNDERVTALVRSALGPLADSVPLEVVGVMPWTLRAQIANSYRVGRVFLAGDAAHQFPPTGGLGLNTGIQDAHNLAWKLAAMLNGWAGDGLLDTYGPERRPVAKRNSDQSLKNLDVLSELSVFEGVPSDSDQEALDTWLAEPGRQDAIARAIDLQLPHFDSLALQLGYSYDPLDEPITDVSEFVPRALPGRRLPHGRLGPADAHKSVLELLNPAAFTLLILGHGITPPQLTTVAPVTAVLLDPRDPSVAHWMNDVGLADSIAVLVRPDGHIVAIATDEDEMHGFERAILELVGVAQAPGPLTPLSPSNNRRTT
jgi:2-polyprenyl-6-methoxyphenol hydroxylase-like FAD-dependent oxidoreductase